MDARKRQIKGSAARPPRSENSLKTKRSKANSKSFTMQSLFFLFVSIVGFVMLVAIFEDVLPVKLYSNTVDSLTVLPLSLGLLEHQYAVIIDAGSTGSRVLAFTFHKSLADGSLKLDDELFVELKPGLSSFADSPKKGAKIIEELLDRAKKVIPQSAWSRTPLSLKATAGLRLLPENKADALLQEVKNTFHNSGFWVTENSVSIMGGVEEGLFSWFTVNFLFDLLGSKVDSTITALDLGGGSTQITFGTTDDKTLKESPKHHIQEISAFHKKIHVYTHSYLGLGLMAARMSVLMANNSKDSLKLRSPCVNPLVKHEWSYQGKTYTVMGPENASYRYVNGDKTVGEEKEEIPIANYEECLRHIHTVLGEQVHKPSELKNRKIGAFSYYFDRATETALIDPLKGGVVKVHDFFKTAREVCDTANVDQPFMCLDVAYIASLLHNGFGLELEQPIQVFKKIDGHEVSWALGAAYHILQNGL